MNQNLNELWKEGIGYLFAMLLLGVIIIAAIERFTLVFVLVFIFGVVPILFGWVNKKIQGEENNESR